MLALTRRAFLAGTAAAVVVTAVPVSAPAATCSFIAESEPPAPRRWGYCSLTGQNMWLEPDDDGVPL